MSFAELSTRPVADLRGAWTRARTEPAGSRPQNTFLTNRASRAENVRFDGGRVIGRDGFLVGQAVTGKVTGIFQWIAFDELAGGNINRLVTFENGQLRIRDLIAGGSALTVEALSDTYGVSVVEAANRVYASSYKSGMVGSKQVRIIHPLIAGSPADKAFMGPMTIVPTISEPGAGVCTPGLHKFAYVAVSRSGFRGKPSPYSGAVFSPVSATVGADKTVRVTVDGTMPTDIAYLRVAMTTTENLERFYEVPGVEIAIPPGVPYTAQLDISITDEDLANGGTDLTDNQGYLTQMSGVGPITPYHMAMLGKRAAYFTGTLVYVSDPDDYEVLTEANHIIQVQGGRQIITGFQLRGVNYLLGPKWTYAVVETENFPVTWATPYSVSESLGTTAIHGVEVQSSGDFVWIANEEGLWEFNGGYPELPISYMNSPEWRRINWSVARYAMRILDDTINQRVSVFVPLDAASDLSHRLTWSYARGRGPMQVDFSLDVLPSHGAACLVKEPSTQRSRVWVGPAAAGTFLVEDSTAYADGATAFESIWESGEVFRRRTVSPGVDQKVQGVEATVKGVGNLLVKVYDKGRKTSEDLAPAALEELPDDHYESGCDVESPDVTVEFKTTLAGERMDLESFTVYSVPWLTNR